MREGIFSNTSFSPHSSAFASYLKVRERVRGYVLTHFVVSIAEKKILAAVHGFYFTVFQLQERCPMLTLLFQEE